jgi:hypothetical protein
MIMFKATHKRRATTLSKTLLTAGLLGGAALSTLGAGSAQAAWDLHEPLGYICTIAPTLGGAACEKAPAPGATTDTPVARPGSGMWKEDKLLTLLDWVGLRPNDTIAFTLQQAATPNPRWELDLDFSDDRIAGDSGSLDYKIEITDPAYVFQTASLSTLLSTAGDYTVNKKFYTDASYTTEISAWALSNPTPGNPDTTAISGQKIFVRDSWNIPSGSTATIDDIQNNYTQVPAPLPLLGVGAAFGSIRKLRKFSSQLKTFSMG